MKLLQWARRNGEIVHISQVERGAACQCVCDKCGSHLIARRGPVRVDHFAHTNSDCQGNQETLLHLKAKEIISESKRLVVQGHKGNQEVVFDHVEIEQPVGPYRVDAVGVKSGKQCMIEIAVTHRCAQEKVQYFRSNKLVVVEIALDARREFDGLEAFAEYVISTAPRTWLYNPVLEEKIRKSTEATVSASNEYSGFLGQLVRSAGPRKRKLHYGELVEVDLRDRGISLPNALCVTSPDLPREFGNLALVKWGYKPLREAVGHRVGFAILFDEECSVAGQQDVPFPYVDVRWVEGMKRKLLPEDLMISGWERGQYDWI